MSKSFRLVLEVLCIVPLPKDLGVPLVGRVLSLPRLTHLLRHKWLEWMC